MLLEVLYVVSSEQRLLEQITIKYSGKKSQATRSGNE